MVEPWDERVLDLSVQFDVDGPDPSPGVRVHPWQRFLVDDHGRYRGACIGRPLEGLPQPLLRWLHEQDIQTAMQAAIRPVALEMAARGFRGPAGVDAYVAVRSGQYHLRPLVELNPRVTMGRIAMAVGRHVRRARRARLRVVTAGQLQAAGTTVAQWTATMSRLPMPTLRDGLIDDGVVMLTEPRSDRRLWVVLEVG